ncbi:MAG TPA: hypothetical protein VGR19_02795 [Allosphingosinicella sp.]|nr:hypothetical protein [Allosphingosinicella sp.]
MGWIIGELFGFIWNWLGKKVDEKGRPWMIALFLLAPVALVVALFWMLS